MHTEQSKETHGRKQRRGAGEEEEKDELGVGKEGHTGVGSREKDYNGDNVEKCPIGGDLDGQLQTAVFPSVENRNASYMYLSITGICGRPSESSRDPCGKYTRSVNTMQAEVLFRS